MLESERNDIPFLDIQTLERRAQYLEDESKVERTYAELARGRADQGDQSIGPESWSELASVHQHMADNRRKSAAIYREAIAERESEVPPRPSQFPTMRP